jgi:gas vesicle GvpC-like protein
MTLTKKQKTVLGIGAVAVAAYLIWKQSQDKQNFVNRKTLLRDPFNAERDRLALEVNEFLSQTTKQRQEQARRQARELLEFKQQLNQQIIGGGDAVKMRFLPGGCKKAIGCSKATGAIICAGKDDATGLHHYSDHMKDGSTYPPAGVECTM